MKIALVITLAFVVSCVVAAPKKDNCWDCSCTTSYDPVCGSNDETYSNKCNLACAQGCNSKIKLAYKGQCGSKKSNEDGTTMTNLEGVTEAPSKDEAEPVKEEALEDDAAGTTKIVEEIMMMEAETTSRSQTSNDEEEQTTTKN